MDAGIDAFATHGFDTVTVDDVCRAAGIAKGTFYFHFPSKDALLVAIFFGRSHDLVEETDGLIAAEAPIDDALGLVVRRVAESTATLPASLVVRAIRVVLAAVDRSPGRGEDGTRAGHVIERLVAAAQRRGEIATAYRADELAMALNWALLQGMLVWAARRAEPAALEPTLHRRFAMLLDGIRAHPRGVSGSSPRAGGPQPSRT